MGTIRLLVLATFAVAVMAIGVGSPRQTEAGIVDPQTLVEDFFANVDEGDFDGAVALLSDDFLFTQIDEQQGSFATVGKPAFGFILAEVVELHNTSTLTDVAADGNVVTGVAEFSDDDSTAAGVDRYLQPFVITVNDDGLISRADFTFDTDDPQTATYLDYTATQEEDGDEGEPPGSVTVALSAQPGGNQPGEAFIFEEEGLTLVGLFVEPGPAGVVQPAHFHTGTCAAPGPIVEPLASVLNGQSFTVLSATQAELVDTGLIINVHKSVAEASVYVSCGEVLSAPAPAPTTAPAPVPTATAGTGVTAPDTGSGPSGDNASGSNGTTIAALLTLAGVAILGVGAFASRKRQR